MRITPSSTPIAWPDPSLQPPTQVPANTSHSHGAGTCFSVMGMFYSCPQQETVEVIETCGKFSRVAEPGFNCVLCCIGETVAGRVSLRIQQLNVTCETKTKDNVFVSLVVSVQYQVQTDKVFEAYYKLTNSQQQISSYIFDVVRAAVPKLNLDDVFVEKEGIAQEIKEQLTKAMSAYGYLILDALVTDIDPATTVKAAMNEINAARRQRIAALEKAEADKVTKVKAAEAEAEATFLQGQGVARQRGAIMSGFSDSVNGFSSTISEVSPKEVLELLMITQYFDMLKDVGQKNRQNTLFLSHAPGALQELSAQIRAGIVKPQA